MNAKPGRPLIFPVYVPTLLLAVSRGLLIPILPLYAGSFDISYGLIGIVLAGEGIGTLAADIPAGLLLRVTGRKPAMLLGVALMGIPVLALVWASSISQVFACRLLTGIGTALFNISRHAYIADVTSLHQRGRALSIFGGVNRIGNVIGPAIGGILGSLYSFQAVFLLYGGLAAIPLFILGMAVEKDSGEALRSHRSAPEGHLARLVGVLRSRRRQLAAAGSGQLFAQMLRMSRSVIIPLYAVDIIGLDGIALGAIISIAGFVDMCMFYPAGLIMDRYGRKCAVVPCFLGQAIGMALVPFSAGFSGLLLATCLIGLANGIGSGSMMTLGADLAPPDAMGEFLGIWRFIGDAGHAGGPLVVGGVADLLGLAAAPWVMSGVGLLASATFAFLVPETLEKGPPGT